MPYVTVEQSHRKHQMTFEDILFERVPFYNHSASSAGGTVTFFIRSEDTISRHLRSVSIQGLIQILERFNDAHADLFKVDRRSLYHTFHIPKHSGGFRKIDEPQPQLMAALRELKAIFEDQFNMLHHTSAFAYVRGRCTIDAVKRHQQNGSKWFLKTDFSNFFGSTTEDFLWNMVSRVFPFSEVVASERGANALRKALNLCFLDGGLPQGTPMSPSLTNLMMIPVDHRICNALAKRNFVYTRYADDILISHRESFNHQEMCRYIESVLSDFGAPFHIKPEKTRYGSSAGRNWNLGVMLNKDNKITIGRKNKEYLKAACTNYIRDKKNGVQWELHDILVLKGKLSYYRMVEQDYVDQFIQWFNEKNGVNLLKMLRDDLK